MTDDAERPDLAPRKEPAFNAPLMAVVLPLLMIGCYALQISSGPGQGTVIRMIVPCARIVAAREVA